MAQSTQRVALLADVKDIWGLVRQVAADIPFDLESETAQENVLTEVMACCTSGLSPVVFGEDKSVVGVLLVRRDDFEWGFRNGAAVRVPYAAIAPSHRDRGVLQALVAEVQGRQIPVFATVRSNDRLGLAAILEQLGFAQDAESGWGTLYKWQPTPAH